jgi:phage anti-repressor protein
MLNIFQNTNKQGLTLKNGNSIKLLDNNVVNKLRKHFTEEEQQLYFGNLLMYMNYHQTNDYVINLENVFKMIGFANKGNAKRTLENNFTKDEDYKITILPSEKGQIAREDIMLNVDTFKNLCMMAKTSKGKVIRKYYVKLENVYNEIIKEEIENQKLLLEKEKETTIKLLQAKEQELLRYKEKTYEEIEKTGHIYVIKTDGGTKVGKTKDAVNKRIRGLQTGNVNNIEILLDFKTSNPDLLEKCAHYILDRYRCNSNREFFDCDINYIKTIVEICGNTIDTLKSTYQHISNDELVEKLKNNGIEIGIEEVNMKECDSDDQENDDFHNWLEENIQYKYNSLLQLGEVCELYLNTIKVHSSVSSKYKKEMEKYIKKKYKQVKSEYGVVKINDITYNGWKHLCFKN